MENADFGRLNLIAPYNHLLIESRVRYSSAPSKIFNVMKIKLNSFHPSFSFLLFKRETGRESKWRRKNFFLCSNQKKVFMSKILYTSTFYVQNGRDFSSFVLFPPSLSLSLCTAREWQTNLIRYQITAKHFSWILLLLFCLPKGGALAWGRRDEIFFIQPWKTAENYVKWDINFTLKNIHTIFISHLTNCACSGVAVKTPNTSHFILI